MERRGLNLLVILILSCLPKTKNQKKNTKKHTKKHTKKTQKNTKKTHKKNTKKHTKNHEKPHTKKHKTKHKINHKNKPQNQKVANSSSSIVCLFFGVCLLSSISSCVCLFVKVCGSPLVGHGIDRLAVRDLSGAAGSGRIRVLHTFLRRRALRFPFTGISDTGREDLSLSLSPLPLPPTSLRPCD